MNLTIEPYVPAYLPGLYDICLRTGDQGEDASALYRDPLLLGHYYAAPYAVLEPDLCFVLACDGAPRGYILGTRDTPRFWERCETEWFPPLRARYPLPPADDRSADAEMIRRIHAGRRPDADLAAYPAHLHIDLLPEAQGQGLGRALMETFLNRLRALGVPAVHLGVARANTRAIGFYHHAGFHTVRESPYGLTLGMALGAAPSDS